MKYKVYKYSRGKLTSPITKEFDSLADTLENLKWWYQIKRNDVNSQFIIVDEGDNILQYYVIDKEFVSGDIDKLINFLRTVDES